MYKLLGVDLWSHPVVMLGEDGTQGTPRMEDVGRFKFWDFPAIAKNGDVYLANSFGHQGTLGRATAVQSTAVFQCNAACPFCCKHLW